MQNQTDRTADTTTDRTADTSAVLRDSVTGAVNQIMVAFQPQLNEFATNFATGTLDRVEASAKTAMRSVERHPWYLLSVAGIMFIGAAFLIPSDARRRQSSTRAKLPEHASRKTATHTSTATHASNTSATHAST